MDWWNLIGYVLVGGGCFGLGMWAMEVVEDIRSQRRRELQRSTRMRISAGSEQHGE